MAPLFATMLDVTRIENYNAADTVLEALNVRAKKNLGSVTLHRKQADALALAGYRQLWQLDFHDGIERAWNPEDRGDFSIGFDKGVLKFQSGSDPAPQPLPFPAAVVDYHPDASDLSPPAFTIDFRTARTPTGSSSTRSLLVPRRPAARASAAAPFFSSKNSRVASAPAQFNLNL